MRQVLVAAAGLALVGCAGPSASGSSAPAAKAPAAQRIVAGDSTVVVTIVGVRNSNGVIRVGLYQEDGFPEADAASKGALVAAKPGTVSTKLTKIAPGTYAVAAYHDENANGEIDTGVFGAPTEGVGFSRDATGTFGPPDFSDAAVEVTEAPETAVRINLKYWSGDELPAAPPEQEAAHR
jgi:uncharacterized protein (DUF2141 family)